MRRLKICLVFFVFLSAVQSAKILSVFHTPSKSHQLLAQRLMLELVKSGHEVTMVSPFPVKNAPQGLRHIHLTGVETYYDCKLIFSFLSFPSLVWRHLLLLSPCLLPFRLFLPSLALFNRISLIVSLHSLLSL